MNFIADIESACGAYWTDVYFYNDVFLDNLWWLDCTVSSSYLEECQKSDLHHYLTSHDVGLASHILVESYDILIGCSTGERSTKQLDGCETILVFLRRAIDSGEHCCLGLDMLVFPLCKC